MAGVDLLTILSTDWVASTATRVRLGEERADSLQQVHDRLVRDAVVDAGGSVVKGSGDGVLATFDAATDALSAAVAVQQAFDGYARSADAIAAVVVRAGISVGDVVHQDGDIFGTPVVEAVRLCDAASPGEILVSDVVRHLARGRGGFDFEVVGLLELKGLPDPVATCSVRWARHGASRVDVELPPELVLATPKPFVGRETELGELLGVLGEATQAQAVWLAGEPGIGKTRLATELAARAAGTGAVVLFGRCDEDIGAPFQPFLQALRWFVSHVDDAGLADSLGADPEPLARLLPELARRAPELAGHDGADTENQQFRLFEAVRSWLAAVGAPGGVVLVIDDVHWADRPTQTLLGHLVRSADPSRLLVVATARDTDPDRSDSLDELVDGLERTGRSRRVRLGGLDVADIAALVEQATDEGRPGDVAARLATETAGNPLYLGALLAADRDAVVGDVRAALRLRTRRLPPPVVDLLGAAAVAGIEFNLPLVIAATGIDEDDGLDRVEHAVRSGLVEELGVDRFRFTHGLLRDSLVDDLSASRRARLHGAIAAAIEAEGPLAVEEDLRALAHHHARAGDGPAARLAAVDYGVRAGRRAQQQLAFDVAADDFAVALDRLERFPPPEGAPSRLEVLLDLGRAERLAGRFPAARATLRETATLAAEQGDDVRLALAAVSFEQASWQPGELGHDAVRLLATAAERSASLPDALAVEVQSAMGRALHFSGRLEQAKAVADAALVRARAIGDDRVLAHAIAAVAQTRAEMTRSEVPELFALVEELWTLGALGVDDELLSVATQFGFTVSITAGDRDSVDRWLQRHESVVRRVGSRFARLVYITDCYFAAFLDGRLDDAERLADEQLEMATRCGIDFDAAYGLQIFLVRREQDRLGELAPTVRFLLRSGTARLWGPGLVLLLAELGMRDEAAAEIARFVDGLEELPRDTMYPQALSMVVEAGCLIGIPEAVASAAARLAPWEGMDIGAGHSAPTGSTDRILALQAQGVGDLDAAERHYVAAVDVDRRLRSPTFEARTLSDWAWLRHDVGDRAGAASMAAAVRTLAARRGLARSLRRVDGL